MKKKFKILFFILLILVLVIFTGLFILSKIHHKSIHEKMVRFINDEFDGKVIFQDFSFSYLSHFPKANIRLTGISVWDDSKEVVKIGRLDISLNTFSLLRKKIELDNLVVKDAEFYSIIDSLGNKPRILAGKSNKSDSVHNALLVEAHNIRIIDSKVYFENQVKGNRTGLTIRKAWFDLVPKDSLLIFHGNLTGHLDSLISNNSRLFANQPIQAKEIEISINRFNGIKELTNGFLQAHTLKLFPKLKMKPHEDGQIIDLHISGEDNFDAFLEMFEFHSGFDLQQVNPESKLTLTYHQSGFVNPFQRPFSELIFEITNAEFTGEKLPFPLKVIDIRGNYNNGEGHSPETVELDIDTIRAAVNESYINGRFTLKNLKDPVVDAHLISNLDLSHIVKETKDFKLIGTIDFDLLVAGKISELKKENKLGEHSAKGQINVHNLKLVLKGQDIAIDLVSGSTFLKNEIFEVSTLVGAFNKSAFHFNGIVENWDHYLFEENQSMLGKFEINFDEIDLTKMKFSPKTESKKKESSFFPLKLLSLGIIVNGKKIITDQGLIENLKLDCLVEGSKVKINSFGCNYQDGTLSGSGDVTLKGNEIAAVNAILRGRFRNLDLNMNKTSKDTKTAQRKSLHIPAYLKANLDLQVDNGNIAQIPMKNLQFQAKIENQEVILNKLAVDAFNGHIAASGKMVLDTTGIKKMQLDADLNFSRFNLDHLLNKFKKDRSGSSEKKPIVLPEQLSLTIDLNAASVVYKDAEISNLRTQLTATNKQITLNSFYTDLPFGNLAMNITVKDYLTDNRKFIGSVDLSIDSLEVDRFLELEVFGLPGAEENKVVNETLQNKRPIPGLPQNINLDLNIDADYLSYKNATISHADMKIDYKDNRIDLHKLKFQFAGGTIDVHGHILKDKPRSYPGYIYSKVDSIGISEFFRSFNNFNQAVFTDKNSSGKISWASHYYFEMNKDLSLDPDGNLVIFNTKITDAEFAEVEPIEQTLFFVGHKSKDKMMVKDLNVSAFLFRDEIYFMDVLMNNNIANLDVFGKVDIGEKELNIGFEISLTDLFFKSKKSRLLQTEAGEVDLENDSKVFLKMEGLMANHKLSMINKRKFDNNRSDILADIKKAQKEFGKMNSNK